MSDLFHLRLYQQACRDGILSALGRHASTLAVMPTGTGKTETYLALATSWPSRVLVIGHRDFLIRQPAERLARRGYTDVAVEMGDDWSNEGASAAHIVFASIQSLARPLRLQRFDPMRFGLVVVDEAHRAASPSYRKVIQYFREGSPGCKVLGLTASPKRADGAAMSTVFESVAYHYEIVDAIRDGWLVPCRQQAVTVDGLDFSEASSRRGPDGATDFDPRDLERICTQEDPLHRVASSLIKIAGDEPGIIFCCTVKHAARLAEVINRYKPHSAAWLCGDSPDEERDRVLALYAVGEIQFLCNVALFTEGFDAPRTTLVVWAAPTQSLVKYTQGFGRGTRPASECVANLHAAPDAEVRRAIIAASSKPYMLCVDYVGNSGRHAICSAVDILGGNLDPSTRQYVRKVVERERRPMSVEEAVDLARAELELRQLVEARRRHIRAAAKFRVCEVDPLTGTLNKPATATHEASRASDYAPEWLVTKLVKLNVDPGMARDYRRSQAYALLHALQAKVVG